MRAVVCPRYGPPEVLRLAELEKPVPREDEVLVRVRATAVTASDLFIRGSEVEWRIWLPFRLMMGLTRPRRAVIGEGSPARSRRWGRARRGSASATGCTA